MELLGVKLKCNCKVFKKAPHFLKALQVILSIAILISVIIIMWGPLERLWYHALCALLISGFACALLAFGVQNAFIERYSCGFLSWNAVEFLYSLILTYYCGDSTWWAYWLTKWNRETPTFLYIICIVLLAALTISYAAAVLYIVIMEVRVLLAKSEYVVVPKNEQLVFLENQNITSGKN